jgi:hypothetical protein
MHLFFYGAMFGAAVSTVLACCHMRELHRDHMRQHHKSLRLIRRLAKRLKTQDDADWWKQN